MFSVEGYRVVRIGEADVQALQGLYERCQVFIELIDGHPPGPNAAAEILEQLPEGKTLEDKFLFGLYPEGEETLVAVLESICGFPDPGEWFIGFLMIDPAHRNAGLGTRFFGTFETWVRGRGATGLRLIVQEQNPGALRFWQRRGFAITGTGQQRTRGRENTVMRLRKPLS